MTPGGIKPMAKDVWRPAALAALATGLYVSIFYIAGNFTMLTPVSAFAVALALTLPFVLAVLLTTVVLAKTSLHKYTGFATAALCALYLAYVLRAPIFEIQAISEFRDQLGGGSRLAANLLYLLLPAVVIGSVFGRSLGKLTVVVAVMSIAAIALGLRSMPSGSPTHEPQQPIVGAVLDRRPNLYLLVADSFASLAYLDANRIDVSEFKDWLTEREFRLYEDTFSNYHATADSMLSMLEMRHHFYRGSHKVSEVSRSVRQSVGGENDLIRSLRRNGFRTQYIHQDDYLLLQGCTADFCYPNPDTFSGAYRIFRKVLPYFVVRRDGRKKQAMSEFRSEVVAQMGISETTAAPRFVYIHLFEPGHTNLEDDGRCDEEAELETYSRNVVTVTGWIESVAAEIIRKDHDAVIVVSGDHGPFISNRCGREVDIDTPAEYRSRSSALTAIRWPKGFDNRFDGRIRTNVNVFRYVLASLIDGSTEALGGHVPDDVFVRGDDQVLKILDDGEFLVPPARLSASELNELYVGDGSR